MDPAANPNIHVVNQDMFQSVTDTHANLVRNIDDMKEEESQFGRRIEINKMYMSHPNRSYEDMAKALKEQNENFAKPSITYDSVLGDVRAAQHVQDRLVLISSLEHEVSVKRQDIIKSMKKRESSYTSMVKAKSRLDNMNEVQNEPLAREYADLMVNVNL